VSNWRAATAPHVNGTHALGVNARGGEPADGAFQTLGGTGCANAAGGTVETTDAWPLLAFYGAVSEQETEHG
jgi:hypothetical protein